MHWVFDSDMPGFDLLKNRIGCYSSITVDGNPVTLCIEADEENGVVRRYVNLDSEEIEVVRGVVKVEPDKTMPSDLRKEYEKLRSKNVLHTQSSVIPE